MSTSIDEAKLKDLLKSAIAEVLEERREFVKEIIEEAMEDVALARAIDEGVGTDAAPGSIHDSGKLPVKTAFRETFARDLKGVRDKNLLQRDSSSFSGDDLTPVLALLQE